MPGGLKRSSKVPAVVEMYGWGLWDTDEPKFTEFDRPMEKLPLSFFEFLRGEGIEAAEVTGV
jgi:hypothetical protein